nr:S8 family serine peptidase [Isoptericola variabilis]
MGYQPVVSTRAFSPIGRVFNLRVAGTLCATLALTGIATGYQAGPARADDRQITAADQPYYSYYHLDSARAKGYTGAGVTIAIIDGSVDTSVPELAGANITDKTPCTVNSSTEHAAHGTTIAALLVSHAYGVVPDATLLAYQSHEETSTVGSDCKPASKMPLSDLPSLINHAINDGASVINLSASSNKHDDTLKWAIARAMNEGVLITAAAGNAHEDENETSLSWWSGVIGVSAIDTDGKFASYSSWGQGLPRLLSAALSLGGMKAERFPPLGAPLFQPLSSPALSRRRVPSGPTRPRISSSSSSSILRLGTNKDGINTAVMVQQISAEC